MGSALSWPDDGLGEGGFMIFGRLDDGLGEGGFMIFGRGAGAKISRGPKPFFYFFEKILLAKKIFFLGPRGARAPLAFYLGPSLLESV